MHWFKRAIAAAVLSMSTALAGVGASYGQETVVRITGSANTDRQVAAEAFQAPGLDPGQIEISDAARRPGI
ncbi:hypothetical protein KMZ93_21525 [Bradyrhizobium sediminis]|uniref:Uncharacterized protein n=1 Tax=Bradyrhizobium sediminis TaxID=2840469 RepID=A0A975NW71_9BRAD|nr:hypothetical protein [Bradyrhizobium sediminis]QWG22517.1 hypothetical protein KMZ93_21525 [Bradyrhizobium sediminis]